jgi:hypothetical protein
MHPAETSVSVASPSGSSSPVARRSSAWGTVGQGRWARHRTSTARTPCDRGDSSTRPRRASYRIARSGARSRAARRLLLQILFCRPSSRGSAAFLKSRLGLQESFPPDRIVLDEILFPTAKVCFQETNHFIDHSVASNPRARGSRHASATDAAACTQDTGSDPDPRWATSRTFAHPSQSPCRPVSPSSDT